MTKTIIRHEHLLDVGNPGTPQRRPETTRFTDGWNERSMAWTSAVVKPWSIHLDNDVCTLTNKTPGTSGNQQKRQEVPCGLHPPLVRRSLLLLGCSYFQDLSSTLGLQGIWKSIFKHSDGRHMSPGVARITIQTLTPKRETTRLDITVLELLWF